MTLPSQPLPTIGQPNATEDAKTLSALAEMQAILTGDIGADNTGNRFLQLASVANRKVSWGTGTISFGAVGYNNVTVNHNLGGGTTPIFAIAAIDRRAQHGDNSDATFGPQSWTSTQIVFRGHLNSTAYAFSINVGFLWLAIG